MITPKSIKLEGVGNTTDDNLIVKMTSLGEIGIMSTAREQAVYWAPEDTEKVIQALKEVI
jgi:hypothetical protein